LRRLSAIQAFVGIPVILTITALMALQDTTSISENKKATREGWLFLFWR
jgi:hypothetical protein